MEQPSNYIYLRLWKGIGVAFLFVVLLISLLPAPFRLDVQHIDKVYHALAYAGLMFWFVPLYRRKQELRIFMLLIVMGACIEGLQYFSRYHSAEVADVAANIVGLMVGWGLARTPVGQLIAVLDRKLSQLRNLP